MRKAFTLIELLVVVGLMGLLGSVSVGGYRAMQRGMAEKGVMENVNHLIRAAYQRAQIDRQPTAVYFWNETLRGDENDNFAEIVVGKAVAIRRYGRITKVAKPYLFDEFADLDLSYQTDDAADGSGASGASAGGEGSGGDARKNTMYLYPIDALTDIADSSSLKRSIVDQRVHGDRRQLLYLSGDASGLLLDTETPPGGDLAAGEVSLYAFKLEDEGGVQWKPGMAYGFEFARLELPHGFIFGTQRSTSAQDPVREAGTLVFDVGMNTGNGAQGGFVGRQTITVSELRPGKSGTVEPQPVGDSADPSEEL